MQGFTEIKIIREHGTLKGTKHAQDLTSPDLDGGSGGDKSCNALPQVKQASTPQ